ncbi:MAG: hypothetical protein ACYDDA_13945, partial [Acidiferrobacteraceae bacterium]
QSIRDILNVRDAWKQVSLPNGQANLSPRTPEDTHQDSAASPAMVSSSDTAGALAWPFAESESHRWSA